MRRGGGMAWGCGGQGGVEWWKGGHGRAMAAPQGRWVEGGRER